MKIASLKLALFTLLLASPALNLSAMKALLTLANQAAKTPTSPLDTLASAAMQHNTVSQHSIGSSTPCGAKKCCLATKCSSINAEKKSARCRPAQIKRALLNCPDYSTHTVKLTELSLNGSSKQTFSFLSLSHYLVRFCDNPQQKDASELSMEDVLKEMININPHVFFFQDGIYQESAFLLMAENPYYHSVLKALLTAVYNDMAPASRQLATLTNIVNQTDSEQNTALHRAIFELHKLNKYSDDEQVHVDLQAILLENIYLLASMGVNPNLKNHLNMNCWEYADKNLEYARDIYIDDTTAEDNIDTLENRQLRQLTNLQLIKRKFRYKDLAQDITDCLTDAGWIKPTTNQ